MDAPPVSGSSTGPAAGRVRRPRLSVVDESYVDVSGPGILEAIWASRWVSLVLLLLCVGAGAGYYAAKPSPATASATIGLADARALSFHTSGTSALSDLSRYAGERAAYATSTDVLARAATIRGGGVTPDQLSDHVTVAAAPTADLLLVTGTGSSAASAVANANALVQASQEVSASQTQAAADVALQQIAADRKAAAAALAHDLAAARGGTSAAASADAQQVASLDARATQIRVDAKLFGAGITFAKLADQHHATAGSPLKTVGIGALAGLLLAIFVSWVRADRRYRREVARAVLAGSAEAAGADDDPRRDARSSSLGSALGTGTS